VLRPDRPSAAEVAPARIAGRGMRMLAYLTAHWRGDQNIAQSLFVNGALPYFVLETLFSLVYMLLMFTRMSTYLMSPLGLLFALIFAWLVCFFAWLVWSVVGTTRSAIRTLRSGGGVTSKILAIVALTLVVALLIKTASDVLTTALLVRSYAT